MLTKYTNLDAKSIHKLSTTGLDRIRLKEQLEHGVDLSLELFRAQGLDIIKSKGNYYFSTKFLPLDEAEFCIVDIETNGSKIERHQIIEIAAIKVKNKKIVDSFESLVYCESINPIITELTGISAEDTKDAPPLKTVMKEFKEFLGDSIFIAHDVKFDFTFISDSLIKIGEEAILNRYICSLALAQRTIESYRYALSYLNDLYKLNPNPSHHRAMSDVLTTYGVFILSLEKCEESLNNVEDLIKFSKDAKRLKRPKFDPLATNEEVSE
ncbi:MAG: 3'-5' exonuclease [Campylobacterales bacterium]|nr:3'-5' exonuclease [Campylobacterales bacterium]